MGKAKAIFLSMLVALCFMLTWTIVLFPVKKGTDFYREIEKGGDPLLFTSIYVLFTLFSGLIFSACGSSSREATLFFAMPVWFLSLLWAGLAAPLPVSIVAGVVALLSILAPAFILGRRDDQGGVNDRDGYEKEWKGRISRDRWGKEVLYDSSGFRVGEVEICGEKRVVRDYLGREIGIMERTYGGWEVKTLDGKVIFISDSQWQNNDSGN